MNDGFGYKLTIDPRNKYDKAKKDLIEALNSIRALDPQQQQQLAYEVFGVQMIDTFFNLMQQNFNKNF